MKQKPLKSYLAINYNYYNCKLSNPEFKSAIVFVVAAPVLYFQIK